MRFTSWLARVWACALGNHSPEIRRRRERTPRPEFYLRRLEERCVLNADSPLANLLTIAENAPDGTTVGTATFDSEAQSAGPLTYSIAAGNPSNAFLVVPNTGEVRVGNSAALDFETAPNWELTVVGQSATDPAMNFTTKVVVQLTDVYAPATVQLGGGDATLSQANGRLQVVQGGNVLLDAPAEDVSSLAVVGSSQVDNLVVDFSGGNPVPAGGLHYDGGTQPAGGLDAIELRGTFDAAHFRYDNANDGGITLVRDGVERTIEYRGLEPVSDLTVAANKSFSLSAAADNAVLEEISPGTLRLRSTDAVPTFEATTFTAPTASLTVLGGNGNDKITVTPLSGAFSVTIDGQGGVNTLVIDQADAAAAAPNFQFAGFTFDQTNTPNVASVLANGAISGGFGAVVNVGPDAATGNVNFPESGTGFDSSLSVGRLIYPGLTSGTLALNMPAGNIGTSLRAGLELSWSGGRTLSNQAGDDFVIYESSSSPGGPDAAMVQVHIVGGGWTKWRYETKDSRGLYVGEPSQGAFATAYDLSDFGLTSGQAIDGIRYANMTGADRMEGPGTEKVPGNGVFVATGFVLPGDNGATSSVLPDPGSSATFAYFGNSTFDPDPLYFGVLHPLAAAAVSGGIDQVRVENNLVTITRDGTARPTITQASFSTLEVNTRGAQDSITVALGGASLPAAIVLDGGNPSVGDKVTIEGTTGTHAIALSGNTVTAGPTTISLANLEAAVIDVSAGAAGTGDTVTVNRSFTLAGTAPSLQIVGGGASQLDAVTVNTEFDPVAVAAQTYSFAGISFDQTGTPNQFSELGTGALAGGLGVVVTTRPGNSTSLASGFPAAPTAGYDPLLSLGALWDRVSTTPTLTRFLGLPDTTNNGTAARGGFALAWSGDRSLTDAAGDDLVVYESGTTNSPEPVMVQVHNVNTNSWSSWVYKPATAQAVTDASPNVAFASVYDLDVDFGMAGATIDAIRVVNMIASDRMQSASGIGVVQPGETNPTSTTLPLPGAQASFAAFGSGDFDPDPMYLGVRHALGGVTARNDVVTIDPDSIDVTGYMSIAYAGLNSAALNTGDGADSIRVVPSTTTTYAIDGGSPTIATNPGDRAVVDLTGVGSALMTVTGTGAATLTSTHKTITFAGIDSFGATGTFDVEVSSAANPIAGDDTFAIVRSGAADELSVNGQLVFRADRAAINNLKVDDSINDDNGDRLTINFAGGDPIPAGNINFVGGSVGTDEIVYNGAGITTITHRFDSTTDGRTTIDGSIVDYTGVEQVLDNLGASNRNLVFTGTDNAIILADDTSTAGRSQATSNHSPVLKFANPTATLTVEAGAGSDSVELQQLDATFDAATTLRGQAGDDFILLDSNGAGTAGGTVDWITFEITVDGGGQTGDKLTIEDTTSTRNKNYSVSNVQIGGGEIPLGAAVDTPDPSPTVDGTVGVGEWDQVPTAFDTGPRPAPSGQSILHFNFSEGSGTTTADNTGNGNNGLLVTPIGPQFRATAGIFGGALEFNGTTDYAWFQDASFDVGTQGTVSFWVNMDTVSRRNQFFEGPGNAGFEFQFRENSGGQFYGSPNRSLTGNTDDFAIQSGGAAALVNTWVNLQYTWQKTGASTGEMHLYVNGSEVTYLAGSDSNITSWATVANTAQAFMTMGRDASTTPGAGNTRYFDGEMDDVAWFDVVLNSTQRNTIYLAGPTPTIRSIDQIQAMVGHDQVFDAKAVNPTNGHLIAYWNLDDAPGTSVANGDGGTTIVLNVTAAGTEAQFLPTDGKFGGALDFTNANSYATFQDPTFDIAAEGSLSMWLFMRDGARRNSLFEGADDSGFEFQYRESSSGQFYGTPNRGSGNAAAGDPVIQLNNARNNVGAWHNVIYTWKRTTANSGEMRIYIDGTEVSYVAASNQSVTGWANLVTTVNRAFVMGRDAGAATPDRWLDAKVDDVAWFNQVLTATQRAALQTSSVDTIQATMGHDQFFDAKAVNAANGKLLAYWNLDDAVGTTVVAGDGGTPITLNLNVSPAAEGVAFDTVGGPVLPGPSTLVNAANFDGNLDFIRVTDSASLDFNKTQGTISLWVNPRFHAVDNNAATGFSNLVEDSNEQLELGISWRQDAGASFGNADFYRRIVFSPFENTASANSNVIVSNTRLSFDTWTQVTVTWDFATKSAAIYINGVLDSSLLNNTSNPSIWTAAAGNTGDWIFGGDGKAASRFFDGELADIGVFGSALQASAVQSTYQNGVGVSGGFDLAGAKGRFTWDSTTLYGLIEDYPAGAANSNGPFDNLIVELFINNGTTVAALLDHSVLVPVNNVAGSVVAPAGSDVPRYEFSIPFTSIVDGAHVFDPSVDFLRYRIRTIDGDTATGGFDSRDTTLGWVVEPPDAGGGLRKMEFAKSENFFGIGGRLNYAGLADFTLNAGQGVDTITVVDSNLAIPVTNPTKTFTINAGGGNDDITFASIDTAFRAAITIDGQAGAADHVTFDADLTLGSALSTGNLLVTAELIDLKATVDTTAGTVGDVTFHVGTLMNVTADGDVTAGGDYLTDGTAVQTAGDVTTADGKITFQAPVELTGDVKLTTTGGDVEFDGATATVDGNFLLTIDAGAGDVTFDAAVGAWMPLSGLEVDAANLTVASTLKADDEGIDVDVSDTATFNGPITTTTGGTMTITNGGLLTFADAADVSLDGAFLQDDAGGEIELFANITTTADKIEFQGPLTLKDDVVLTTAGGNVLFSGASATIDGDQLLTISAGAGNVTFDAAIGGLDRVDGVKISSSNNVDFNAAVTLDDRGLDVKAAGTVGFDAAVDTDDGGTAKIDNTGLLTIADAADFTLEGTFSQVGTGGTSLAGDISTSGDDISFNGAVTIAPNTAGRGFLDTGVGPGDITFASTVDATTAGIEDLKLNAGAGNVQFGGIVGGSKALGDVTIDAANNVDVDFAFSAKTFTHLNGTGTTTFDGLTTLDTGVGADALDIETPTIVVNAEVKSTGGDLNLAADSLTVNTATGALNSTATGIVTIVTHTEGQAQVIDLGTDDAAGRLGLTSAELNRITTGLLRIGDAESGAIDVSAAIAPIGTTKLHLKTGAGIDGAGTVAETDLALEAAGDITLDNGNDVDQLAASITGGTFDFSFKDTDALEIGSVDGVVGLTGADRTTLDIGAGLTQTAAGKLTTNELQLTVVGPTTLDNADNDTAILAAQLGGALTYRDASELEIGTVATAGITTTDDNVRIRATDSLSLRQMISVGAALVSLESDDGAIDDVGAAATKIAAMNLELLAEAGIGITQALRTEVAQIAAKNSSSGRIAIDDRTGNALTVGTVDGTSGIENGGLGGISLVHVGPTTVNAEITDAGGGITLTTFANSGDDDHLTLNARVRVTGGTGDIVLTAGTDLLFNDTGFLNDVQIVGAGTIFGNFGRDVALAPSVRIRSATGAIEDVPPLLTNVTAPQVSQFGNASVTFDYGRLLELNFSTLIDWADGVVDFYNASIAPSLFNPGSFTALHTYSGNPDATNPAADIPVVVTLLADPRIQIQGLNETSTLILLTTPGITAQFVKVEVTTQIPSLVFPIIVRTIELPTNNTTIVNAGLPVGSGASAQQVITATGRIVEIREVSADGKSVISGVRLPESVLRDLRPIFAKLRNGRYQIFLYERRDPSSGRMVMEVYIRNGLPAVPQHNVIEPPTTPDGASILPPVDGEAAIDGDLRLRDAEQSDAAAASAAALGAAALVAGVDRKWAARVDAALAGYRRRSRRNKRSLSRSRPK